jgi:hypothetical protein
MIGA